MPQTILKGIAAIRYAEREGIPLNRYGDVAAPASEGLTVAEARSVAQSHPSLIWVAAWVDRIRSSDIAGDGSPVLARHIVRPWS